METLRFMISLINYYGFRKGPRFRCCTNCSSFKFPSSLIFQIGKFRVTAESDFYQHFHSIPSGHGPLAPAVPFLVHCMILSFYITSGRRDATVSTTFQSMLSRTLLCTGKTVTTSCIICKAASAPMECR